MGGFDYQYRTSEFLGNKQLEINTFVLGTKASPENASSFSDEAYGLSINYPNEPISVTFEMLEIGEDLQPAMGYVRRKGNRRYKSGFKYLYRPIDVSKIRDVSFSYSNSFVTDLHNNLETSSHSIYPLFISFASDDYLGIGFNQYKDSFDFDWFIGPDLLVEAGDYKNRDIAIDFTSSSKREFSTGIYLGYGDYYGGKQAYQSTYFTFYPSSFIDLTFYYQYSNIKIGTGKFESHVTSNTILFKFSRNLNWSNTIQYENVSEFAGWNSRLNWEFAPGSNFYVVLNQSYWVSDGSIRVQQTQLTTKGGFNIRF